MDLQSLKIVSGGQTGADRAALDFAIKQGIPHGGWCPKGRISDEAVRLAVIGKLGWIKRQQSKFEAQTRQSRREMVSGESHYSLGWR